MESKEREKIESFNIKVIDECKLNLYIDFYGIDNLLNLILSLRKFDLFSSLNSDEIIALSNFDKNIRTLLFHYILDIELNLRIKIIDLFINKYGETNYLKRENLDLNNLYVDENIEAILDDFNSYKDNDELDSNSVSPNILFNYVTFGNLSKLYFSLKQADRQNIAKSFLINDKKLKQILKNLVILRNRSAHGKTVIDYSSNFEIKNDFELKYVNIFLIMKSVFDLTKLNKHQFKKILYKELLKVKKELTKTNFESLIIFLNISYFSIEI